MPKKVDKPQKKVEEEEKNKDCPCWICENVSRTKSAKKLLMKRKHNDNTSQYTKFPSNIPGLLVIFARLKTHRKQA